MQYSHKENVVSRARELRQALDWTEFIQESDNSQYSTRASRCNKARF